MIELNHPFEVGKRYEIRTTDEDFYTGDLLKITPMFLVVNIGNTKRMEAIISINQIVCAYEVGND